jgi:site-specific DNA recombinase
MASEELVGQRIAIYARFSSEGQRESSIEDQVHRCREFVVSRGGVVRDDLIFSDRATSGAGTGTDRPAYEQLMRLVSTKPSQLDAIVIEDLSRLSRSAADLFTIQRLFEFWRYGSSALPTASIPWRSTPRSPSASRPWSPRST